MPAALSCMLSSSTSKVELRAKRLRFCPLSFERSRTLPTAQLEG